MSERKKYELEFMLKTSAKVLYNMLSTPSGLCEWFADKVDIGNDKVYSFDWEGDDAQAQLLEEKAGEFIRWRWSEDEEDGNDYYFEFQLQPVPSDSKMVLLTVIDFAEDNELRESQLLWENQINTLKRVLGG